jgi:nitroreductase
MASQNEQYPEKLKEVNLSSGDYLEFLKQKRSHRRYLQTPISHDIIRQLHAFGSWAPTGTNCQSTHFLFIRDKAVLNELLKEIMRVYKRFQRLLNILPLRWLMGIFDRRVLGKELRRDLDRIIKRYKQGEDPIFHQATLVVIAYNNKKITSTPYDDACYAMANMTLGGETLGLSSCINGLSTIAFKMNRKIKKMLGIEGKYSLQTCAGFGYPLYHYVNEVFREERKLTIL